MFTYRLDPDDDGIASARLDPNLDTGTLVVEHQGSTVEGRAQYRWEVWVDGVLAQSDNDLRTGVGMDPGPVVMLATLATSLTAAAESYARTMRTGAPGENTDLFNARVTEWAYLNSDELSMLALDIEGDNQ